jgi:hypothetical protein
MHIVQGTRDGLTVAYGGAFRYVPKKISNVPLSVSYNSTFRFLHYGLIVSSVFELCLISLTNAPV